jgi:hypothetical protein
MWKIFLNIVFTLFFEVAIKNVKFTFGSFIMLSSNWDALGKNNSYTISLIYPRWYVKARVCIHDHNREKITKDITYNVCSIELV